MIRSLYVFLLRLHPRCFRERFSEEMLWIFDQAGARDAYTLLVDAVGSLWRQWLLRPRFEEPPLVSSAASPSLDVPAFRVLETSMPRASSLLHGGVLSLLCFSAVTFAIGRGGYPPTLLFGIHYPSARLLGVERSSMEPSDLTTEIKLPVKAEDPWRPFASMYFKMILVLNVIDANQDLILSPREIAQAPASLLKLDGNHHGKLSPEECGLRLTEVPEATASNPASSPDSSETAAANAKWDPESLKRMDQNFMRFHPVLAARRR